MAISFDKWLFAQIARDHLAYNPVSDLAGEAKQDVESGCLKRPFTVDEYHQHLLDAHKYLDLDGKDQIVLDTLTEAEIRYNTIR